MSAVMFLSVLASVFGFLNFGLLHFWNRIRLRMDPNPQSNTQTPNEIDLLDIQRKTLRPINSTLAGQCTDQSER